MTNTKKQTAGNNKVLRGVKKMMNAKIYAHAMILMNTSGESAAVSYLQGYFSVPVNADKFASFVK